MRGGLAMALGGLDVLPKAMLLQADCPRDVGKHHVQKQHTILLVNSVVHTGSTVVAFVRWIRRLEQTAKILVVVVQNEAIVKGKYYQKLKHVENITLVALRLSLNKYKREEATDTGNRLFNITQIS
ncbi:hypothetical protein F4780DRAFT_739575 [Xylariomycetidae sp. FL0641]|nr:hypothetical protein F4780DRAFT_739575 [Xylariomycetidae sp. FL0641]